MQSFDRVLERLVRDGSIALGTALGYSTNRNNLLLNLHDVAGAAEAEA
jgi:Tfp pilus assembly ATPase PilU